MLFSNFRNQMLILALPLFAASAQSQALPHQAVLHATVTVTGGVNFTGTYDALMPVGTCFEVAKNGTGRPGQYGGPVFYVPIPPQKPDGSAGAVSGGRHTFSTDAAAAPYRGPGTYTGKQLSATQLDADNPPNNQETHIFAFPDAIGTLKVNADASGSFQFQGLQDAGSVHVSGQVLWTCTAK